MDAHDSGESDVRMLEQCILNLEGADVGSVVDDDLLFAAEEP